VSRVSSVWPWALTAAAIAAVVCLVGWPHPTLCVAGLITGAIVLLVGLRLLAAEQRQTGRLPCSGCVGCGGPDCAERPDGSGSDPETARTDPDDPEAQPADQAGHEPDDLRTRIADAIRTALKERAIPPLTLYGHQAFPGIDLTEYDLADVVLTVVQPGLTQTEKERDLYGHDADRLRGDWIRMRARAENAEATITRVREVLPFAEKVATTSGPGPASAATAITDRLRTALTPPAVVPCPTGCAIPTGVHHRHIKPADQPEEA
jgi:hypothetical protein